MYDLKHRWIDEASTGCKDNDPDKYKWKIIVTEERFRCEGDGGSCNYESNSYAENDGVLESVKDEDGETLYACQVCCPKCYSWFYWEI